MTQERLVAEREIATELLSAHDNRPDDADHQIVVPVSSLVDLGDRLKRAASLGGSSPLRIGERFLRETDQKLS